MLPAEADVTASVDNCAHCLQILADRWYGEKGASKRITQVCNYCNYCVIIVLTV